MLRGWRVWGWTGRRCVPSVETPIPSGVPPVASGSCAPASSHGEEHLPASPRRNAPHEMRSTGKPDQGSRVPGDNQGTPPTAWRQSSRAVAARGTAIAPPREGPARPVPERRTAGGPTVISIARGGTNLVRPHQGAVSPNNAIRSAQGRVGAHRGALSPKHSRWHPNMFCQLSHTMQPKQWCHCTTNLDKRTSRGSLLLPQG